MHLKDAAAFFDRMVCADAYDASRTFKGQLNLFDDSMRDGTTVVRRVLSVADTVVLPARRAVTIHGEVWLLGAVHNDSFEGAIVRAKYVAHRADGLAAAKTADQALRTLAGSTLYAGRLWVKDLKEQETSSKLSSFMNIYVAPTEVVVAGTFLQLVGRWHFVRNVFTGASGFNICEADELPSDALTTAVYSTKTGQVYNPVNDAVAAGSTPTVPLLYHRWQDDYLYRRMSALPFDDGDIVAHLSKTSIATAVVGDTFVLNGTTYRVLSVRDDGAGAWHLHGRP